MRKNINFRLSTLIDRCHRRSTRYRESGGALTDECHHRKYSAKCYSTRETYLSYRRVRNNPTALCRPSIGVGTQQIKASSGLYFSSSSTEIRVDTWNVRVEEFLARTLVVDKVPKTVESDSEQEVAATIQTLLDDLLEITAASMVGQKGEYSRNDTVYDTKKESYQKNQYLDWMSLSSHASSSWEDDESLQSHASVPNITEEEIDAGLTFALMDRLVALEQADDSALINHTLEWTSHTSCLNPILQLWRQMYSPLHLDGPKHQQVPDYTLTPSDVLTRLDSYRQHSNLLIPDTQSYNIIMDAVATHNNSTGRKNEKSRFKKGKSIVDISFCQSLWEWMWKESNQDSLVRPDEITLRIMLKAHVFTGHALAAQRCEALVDEWAKHHNGQPDNSSKSDKGDVGQQGIHDPRGTLLQSLIHVWALHDPQIAESYLKELAWRYLSGKSHNPPDTIAWNRVVSAYSIAYNQPEKGLEVLESFWEFYRRAHGLRNTAYATTITQSLDVENISDSASINTKSNSMKLSNAIAISSSKEDSGITEDSPKAIDSAIWKVHQPNLQTYNALLEGYARQSNAREANKIFERVQNASSMSPNIATYTSTIKANGSDLNKVDDLAQQCLAAYKAQNNQQGRSIEEEEGKSIPKHIDLDRPFFHAWLHACSKSGNIKGAKKVIKQMKAFDLKPNATSYRLLIDAFLFRNDSQEAIEWLLAYAKLEGMSESAIVSCTTHLLKWYRYHDQYPSSGDVDSMVLLQILCENGYISQEKSLQQLLLGISPNQAKAVVGWLRRKHGEISLKIWAIVIRGLAQEGADATAVEDLFLQLQDEHVWTVKFDPDNASVFDAEEEKLVVEMYSSMIVAWSKQGKFNRRVKRRIQHWKNELNTYREGALSLNLAAQVALVTMYCEAGDPQSSEQHVNDLFRAFEEGRIASPPDTIMCNMVLNAWAKKKNGLRAAAFFKEIIKEPDVVSYNTVINAFAKQGQLERAEEWTSALIASFVNNPIESLRPQHATFTVLLAAWRRSKHPDAAERAEKILKQMHQLHDNDILLSKPNSKSYQTVLDTWEKSMRLNAAKRAEELIFSSSEHKTNKRLLKKVRYIKSRHEKRNREIHKSG